MELSILPSFSIETATQVQSLPCKRQPKCAIVHGVPSATDTRMEKKSGYDDSHSLLFSQKIQMYKRTHMHVKAETRPEVLDRLESSDKDSIASLFQENISLLEGKLLHVLVVKTGLDGDKFLSNLLVSMYGRFGLVEESCCVFDSMQERSLVSWSAIISACTQHGHTEKAISLFHSMHQVGLVPNNITFVSILTVCAGLCALEEGRSLHALLIEHGIEIDAFLGTSLVSMYGKCRDLDAAKQVFNSMESHDTVMWNAMIATCQQQEDSMEAANLFVLMQEREIQPDKSTFVSVISAYASTRRINGGRFVHICIVKFGLDSLLDVTNALVHMHGMCGFVEDAWSVFYHIEQPDVVSWNSMIAACAQEGSFNEAFHLFHEMLDVHVEPTRATFLNMLSACIAPEALSVGKSIHEFISEARGELDMLVATALIDMYSKCGAAEDARLVFDAVERPDVICWNAMIVCYAQQGLYGIQALLLFQKMIQRGSKPDKITFSSILSACADLGALLEGKLIYTCIVENGFDSEIGTVHALIHMYGKCGRLDEARALFNRLRPKELISWNAMITAYSQQGYGKQAVEFYEKMLQEDVRPDEVTFVSLLSACSHAGLIDEGHGYFISMSVVYNLSPSLEHYVCLIDLFGRAGWLEEAEDLIQVMPHKATSAAWSAMLSGCRFHKDIERARFAARKLAELEPGAETSYVLLSNLYSTEGSWEDAERFFKPMPGRMVCTEGSQL